MTRNYWLPVDLHTDYDNMTHKVYATWQRAGRLYTVKVMRVFWENDEPHIYWSLRIASECTPTNEEMAMVNVDERTLTKHMVSENALAAFASVHDGRLAQGDHDALIDALTAMNSVMNDINYWRTVSMLANGNNDDDDGVNLYGPWVDDKDAWLTCVLHHI